MTIRPNLGVTRDVSATLMATGVPRRVIVCSLKAEMPRQVRTPGDSINTIPTCAAEFHRARHHWPPKAPRSK